MSEKNTISDLMHHMDSQFPYVRTNLTDALTVLDSTLDKYGMIFIEGAEGSGKNVLVDHYLDMKKADNPLYGNLSFFHDSETIRVVSELEDQTIIIWDGVERLGTELSSIEIVRRDERRRILTQGVKAIAQNENIVQIFLGRIGGFEQLQYSFPSLATWLNNICAKLTLHYEANEIGKQLIKREILEKAALHELSFSGNFKSFRRAIEASLPDEKKVSLLKGLAGEVFGEVFYKNIKMFKEKPLEVTLQTIVFIPSILSFSPDYWTRFSKLLDRLNKNWVDVSLGDSSNPMELKTTFLMLGILPVEWLQAEISKTTLQQALSEIGYPINLSLSVEENIQTYLGK
jgi:hypothetical protein